MLAKGEPVCNHDKLRINSQLMRLQVCYMLILPNHAKRLHLELKTVFYIGIRVEKGGGNFHLFKYGGGGGGPSDIPALIPIIRKNKQYECDVEWRFPRPACPSI